MCIIPPSLICPANWSIEASTKDWWDSGSGYLARHARLVTQRRYFCSNFRKNTCTEDAYINNRSRIHKKLSAERVSTQHRSQRSQSNRSWNPADQTSSRKVSIQVLKQSTPSYFFFFFLNNCLDVRCKKKNYNHFPVSSAAMKPRKNFFDILGKCICKQTPSPTHSPPCGIINTEGLRSHWPPWRAAREEQLVSRQASLSLPLSFLDSYSRSSFLSLSLTSNVLKRLLLSQDIRGAVVSCGGWLSARTQSSSSSPPVWGTLGVSAHRACSPCPGTSSAVGITATGTNCPQTDTGGKKKNKRTSHKSSEGKCPETIKSVFSYCILGFGEPYQCFYFWQWRHFICRVWELTLRMASYTALKAGCLSSW